MFKNPKFLTLVPDAAGKGGSKPSFHTHMTNPIQDTYTTFNNFIWQNRWRKDSASLLIPHQAPDDAAVKTLSFHAYYSFSTTDPTAGATVQLLSHNIDGTGNNRFWNHTAPGSLLGGLAAFSAPSLPAIFLNIKNRVFISCGGIANKVWDGTNLYDVGVDAPKIGLLYSYITAGVKFSGTAFATQGSVYVADTGTVFGTITSPVGRQINIAGVNYGIIAYTASGMFTLPAGSISKPANSNIVTVTGNVWNTGGQYNGLTLRNITTGDLTTKISDVQANGGNTTITLQSSVVNAWVAGNTYDIQGEQFTLDAKYTGITSWATPWFVNTGVLTWQGVGPKYAYAWYDKDTGHISNISPILTIPENDQTAVKPRLADIHGSPDPRYESIIIFRTLLQGGSVLYPLTWRLDAGLPNPDNLPNPYPLTTTFDDIYDDSYLLTSGSLAAPQLLNNKPPIFAHSVYWDGRVWGNPTSDPSAIYFSADLVQVTFGVPEECYPTTNIIRVPAADGRVTGMRLVGDQMVITTERFAYYVVGTNETNYRIVRFSTNMEGVGDYQIAEIVGDSSGEYDGLAVLARDARVYLMAPGQGTTDLSQPIQTQLSNAIPDLVTYQTCRVHYAKVSGRRMVIVRTPTVMFFYDFMSKVWTQHDAEDSGRYTITSYDDTFPIPPGSSITKAAGSNFANTGVGWSPDNWYDNLILTNVTAGESARIFNPYAGGTSNILLGSSPPSAWNPGDTYTLTGYRFGLSANWDGSFGDATPWVWSGGGVLWEGNGATLPGYPFITDAASQFPLMGGAAAIGTTIDIANDIPVIPEHFLTLYSADGFLSVNAPSAELMIREGDPRQWLIYSSATAISGLHQVYISTFPLDFGSKTKKQINFVRIYVSDAFIVGDDYWKGTITVDENESYINDFRQQVDPVYRIYPPTAVPVDSPTAAELMWFPTGSSVPYGHILPYGGTQVLGPLMGYRFTVKIDFPKFRLASDLYAIQICISDAQPNEIDSI